MLRCCSNKLYSVIFVRANFYAMNVQVYCIEPHPLALVLAGSQSESASANTCNPSLSSLESQTRPNIKLSGRFPVRTVKLPAVEATRTRVNSNSNSSQLELELESTRTRTRVNSNSNSSQLELELESTRTRTRTRTRSLSIPSQREEGSGHAATTELSPRNAIIEHCG